MANYKRTVSKLLRSGFVLQEQRCCYECWTSTAHRGTVSFHREGDEASVFKVHSSMPDRPEFDEFNSFYTNNLSRAIEMSKVIG